MSLPEQPSTLRIANKPSPDWVKDWPLYRKRGATPALRIEGPFEVETREGLMTCEDGYLAVDNNGDPYPIATDVFESTYVPKDIA